MKFPEYKSLDLPQISKDMLQRWKDIDAFGQSMRLRSGGKPFVFYEGPPSANGMPGIHHVMARTIKDIFCRYKTLKGYLVRRKAGWDTHGLPVELAVEKMLGITKEDIGKKISVEEYNAACRRQVLKYTKEWETLTEQMGYWVDMRSPYITCDNRYIESVWHLIKQLYQKGLLYKGYTIQPYSPAAGTGLSAHELNQPGCYRDVKDRTAIAMFKVKSKDNLYIPAWTTTPWTLPSNTALCVGADIDYIMVQTAHPYLKHNVNLILAEALAASVIGNNAYTILEHYKGSDLVGMRYEQLIPFIKPQGRAFEVISGDFVSTQDGTGIVHIAPTFGADDDRAAKQHGIAPLLLVDSGGRQVPMVDMRGRFYMPQDLDACFLRGNVDMALYDAYAGKYVKDAYYQTLPDGHISLDDQICIWLKERGLLYKSEKHTHSYPHCWRTDKPVLYYPLDSWFIRTTACRERMIALNRTINWKPESTGSGRFGKWLEDLKDWNFSRSRYWGTPLPIWRTADGTEEKCIGSIAELMAEAERAKGMSSQQ
jgi:isoleucyl-tRNA synthetase